MIATTIEGTVPRIIAHLTAPAASSSSRAWGTTRCRTLVIAQSIVPWQSVTAAASTV